MLRFPRDGQGVDDLQVVSKGNRNTYDLVWAPVPVDPSQPDGEVNWALFGSENGPDYNDAPDEVNHIRWGHDYGFPDQFGPVPAGQEDAPYSSPVAIFTPHSSADGLAYITNPGWPAEYRTLYISLFGEIFDPKPVGHTVDRIPLQAVETPSGLTYRSEPSVFITGLQRPLPMTVDTSGNLLAGDYLTGILYRVHH